MLSRNQEKPFEPTAVFIQPQATKEKNGGMLPNPGLLFSEPHHRRPILVEIATAKPGCATATSFSVPGRAECRGVEKLPLSRTLDGGLPPNSSEPLIGVTVSRNAEDPWAAVIDPVLILVLRLHNRLFGWYVAAVRSIRETWAVKSPVRGSSEADSATTGVIQVDKPEHASSALSQIKTTRPRTMLASSPIRSTSRVPSGRCSSTIEAACRGPPSLLQLGWCQSFTDGAGNLPLFVEDDGMEVGTGRGRRSSLVLDDYPKVAAYVKMDTQLAHSQDGATLKASKAKLGLLAGRTFREACAYITSFTILPSMPTQLATQSDSPIAKFQLKLSLHEHCGTVPRVTGLEILR
ncbi:hypothetical protein QBC40DRAFT_301517 [Triangularia verruculosa]|uniref:Uncharacterized protein n=1 Tax=Triangularia verruculosa TaxID=2587418 RepID=A0AAN6X7W9_9PEZI|nr:hypothetical protein QBC40DRAFT_301517 [Triangularia verruculosa]